MYPFGMIMPGRNSNGTESAYRYAYNGMEADAAVKGERNSYTTEFRQYDPRLGRWLSLDPLMGKLPNLSPFNAFNNNPVFFTDPDGDLPGPKFFVKLASGAWKSINRKAFNNYLNDGAVRMLKIEGTKSTKKQARKAAEKIHGKENVVNHTEHTIAKNSKKVTQPHYQHKNGGKTKVFYQASPVLVAPAGVGNQIGASDEIKDFFGEMIVFIVEILLGESSTAHGQVTNLNLPPPATTYYQEPTAIVGWGGNHPDRDGDEIVDGEDYICNACGENEENLILIGTRGSNDLWATVDGEEYGAIQKGGDDALRVFNQSVEEHKILSGDFFQTYPKPEKKQKNKGGSRRKYD